METNITEQATTNNSTLNVNDTNIYFIISIRYFSIMLLIFGTIGNITAIATFSRKNMRQNKIVPYVLSDCRYDFDLVELSNNYLDFWRTSIRWFKQQYFIEPNLQDFCSVFQCVFLLDHGDYIIWTAGSNILSFLQIRHFWTP